MEQKKKVLIISYLFPPMAGGGVPRALKMSKYLSQYGWDPVILTVDPQYHVEWDHSLLHQIPEGTPIYRAREWNPYQTLVRLRGTGKGELKSNTTEKEKGSKERELKAPDFAASQVTPPQLLTRLKSGLFSFLKKLKQYLLIPDDQILWVPFAIGKGLQAIKQEKIDAIFSTSGPYSNHLVAKALAKKTGIPWIADFRDPWTQNMHRSGIPWREKIEERQERQVMKQADIVTTVTRSFATNFKAKFPEIKRIEVIHNGYDPDDYSNVPINPNSEKMVFAYTGIFYQERNPRLFLQAVAELIAEGKINREQILIRFAGVFDYPGYSENIDAVRHYGLQDVVEVLGYLPHRDSLAILKNADVLLLIGDTAAGSEAYIPGKLYEYLAVERPILSLSLPGESTDIIQRFGIGVVVNPLQIEEIKEALITFVEAWNEKRLQDQFSFAQDEESLAVYRRDIQAKELSKLLNDLTETSEVPLSSNEY